MKQPGTGLLSVSISEFEPPLLMEESSARARNTMFIFLIGVKLEFTVYMQHKRASDIINFIASKE